MTYSSNEFATRDIVVWRVSDPREPDFNSWYARFPDVDRSPLYGPGDIAHVVSAARDAPYGVGSERNVKVAEGTKLESRDVLTLIEANGGWPRFLDLTGCELEGVDLSRHTIAQERADYVERNGVEPPWFSDRIGGVFLWHAQLTGVRLAYAQLEGADLRLTNFDNANLFEANLRAANLLQARLRRAHLAEAQFQEAHLEQAQLQGAFLRGTQFQRANLRWAELQGVDFYTAGSLAAVRWNGAFLDRTRMRREQLGGAIGDEVEAHRKRTSEAYHEASEAYLLLKNNFNSIGRYEDAAWAYVKEQRMEKAALMRHLDWQQFPRRPFWRAFTPWALNWAWDALTGYGETPQKPLGVATVLASLFFPLLYWATGALPGHSRALASSSSSDIDWAGWVDSLIFSLTTFGTLSFSRLQPEGTLGNLIASVEAMVAVLLFALFVYTLGNRMSRS